MEAYFNASKIIISLEYFKFERWARNKNVNQINVIMTFADTLIYFPPV